MKKLGCGFAAFLLLIAGGPMFLMMLTPRPTQSPTSQGYLMGAVSDLAKQDIPPEWLTILLQAGGRYNVPWGVLAGIGKVETDFGRSTLPGVHSGANSAGAEGPMQFEPATWATYRADCGGGGDIYDFRDAVCGAARYLAASGAATGDIPGAIWTYNHADWYVAEVLAWAAKYAVQSAIEAVGGLLTSNLPPVTGIQLPGGEVWKPLFDSNPSGGFAVGTFPWGQCTWFVASERRVTWNGDAWMWAENARSVGRTESDQPSVGAIVVWPAGVGYSEFGHVAVVVAVNSTSYTVAESNFLGLGDIDQRQVTLPDPAHPTFIEAN